MNYGVMHEIEPTRPNDIGKGTSGRLRQTGFPRRTTLVRHQFCHQERDQTRTNCKSRVTRRRFLKAESSQQGVLMTNLPRHTNHRRKGMNLNEEQSVRETTIEEVSNELRAIDYLTSIQGYGFSVSTLTISGDREHKRSSITSWADLMKSKSGDRNSFRIIVVEH